MLITPEECWGSVIGDDSEGGACQMCVYICAEVFEKPVANRCARVRLGVNPTQYAAQVCEAAEYCPVDAIRITGPREVNDGARRSNRFLSPMRNTARGGTCV